MLILAHWQRQTKNNEQVDHPQDETIEEVGEQFCKGKSGIDESHVISTIDSFVGINFDVEDDIDDR